MRMIDKNFNNWLPASVLLLLLGLMFVGCMNPEGKKRLETLQQLAAAIPVYPEFTQVNTNHVVKKDGATLAFYYQSPASYKDEVRDFYIKELTARGWRMEEEETYGANTEGITFRKGEYSIAIFHSSPRDQDWDFSLGYQWERP